MGRRSHIGNQHRRRLLDPQQWGIATRSAVVSAVVVLVALILAGAGLLAVLQGSLTSAVDEAAKTREAEIAAALRTLCEKWETDYPGVAVKEREADLLIDIPTAVRTTHEDHFANVLGEFVRYFHQPRQIPAWETPNLLAKYALTTAAVQLAVQKQQVPG